MAIKQYKVPVPNPARPKPKSPPPKGDNGSGNEDWAPNGWGSPPPKKAKPKK